MSDGSFTTSEEKIFAAFLAWETACGPNGGTRQVGTDAERAKTSTTLFMEYLTSTASRPMNTGTNYGPLTNTWTDDELGVTCSVLKPTTINISAIFNEESHVISLVIANGDGWNGITLPPPQARHLAARLLACTDLAEKATPQ
jgi:hypothetical protein